MANAFLKAAILLAFLVSVVHCSCGNAGVSTESSVPLADIGSGCTGTTVSTSELGQFGYTVSTIGDINNDGHADYAIGAISASSTGELVVIFGSGSYPGDIAQEDLDGTNGVTFKGKLANSRCGYSIAPVGDFNGDSIDDFAFGCDRHEWINTYPVENKGAAYVIYGKETWDATFDISTDIDATTGVEYIGGTKADNLGVSIAGGRDLNNDGFVDIAIGALTSKPDDGTNEQIGAVYLLWGTGANHAEASYVVDLETLNTTKIGVRITASPGYLRFGHSLVLSDNDGDGKADIIIGAPGMGNGWGTATGWLWVMYNKDSWPLNWVADLQYYSGDDGYIIKGASHSGPGKREVEGNRDGLFGLGLATGDVNGDGIEDIIASSPKTERNGENSGSIYVMWGSSTPPYEWPPVIDLSNNVDASLAVRFDGDTGDVVSVDVDWFNSPQDAAAGDFNGDGLMDIAYGTYGTGGVGAVSVIYGSSSWTNAVTLISTILDGRRATLFTGLATDGLSGWAVGSTPNAVDPAKDDLLVGSPGANVATRVNFEEFVELRCDITVGVSPASGRKIDLAAMNDDCEGTTFLAGDGQDFAQRVGSIGDINGDGNEDFGFGATSDGAGSVYVFFGDGDREIGSTAMIWDYFLDGQNGFVVHGETDGSRCGFSLAGVGDLNGDGVDDFAFGCDRIEMDMVVYPVENTGSAYVIYGKQGWGASIELTDLDASTGIQFIGGTPYDHLGVDVAGGLDINGDGFSDLAIGAMSSSVSDDGMYNQEDGAVYLIWGTGAVRDTYSYELSQGTLDSDDFGVKVTTEHGWVNFGHNIEMADNNGDGKADLIVAGPGAMAGAEQGWVWVVFGTASATTWSNPTYASEDPATGYVIKGPGSSKKRSVQGENDSLFGLAIATTDFNGDGIIDIIASAPQSEQGGADSGSIYVIWGSDESMSDPAVIDLANLETETTAIRFDTDAGDLDTSAIDAWNSPTNVAAGDFNGDGTGDFAFGVPSYNSGDGGVYVVYGGSGWTTADRVTSLSDITDVDQAQFFPGVKTDGTTGWSIAAIDSDSDGRYELLIGSPGAELAYNVHWSAFGSVVEPPPPLYAPAPTDMYTPSPDNSGPDPVVPPPDSYCWTESTYWNDPRWLTCDPDAEIGEHVHLPCTGKEFVRNELSFGRRASSVGDVNGDGFNDFAITARHANVQGGYVYVFYGGTSGFVDNMNRDLEVSDFDGTNGFVITAPSVGDDLTGYNLGSCVTKVGDFNGDGIDDFLVGAERYFFPDGHLGGDAWKLNAFGAAFLFYGRDDSDPFPALIEVDIYFTTDTGVSYIGGNGPDFTGSSCDGGLDVNNDGMPDVVVGSVDHSVNDQGAAFVLYGKQGGYQYSEYVLIPSVMESEEIGSMFLGQESWQYWSTDVIMIDDFNGDGIADFAMSSWQWSIWWPEVNERPGFTVVVFGQDGKYPTSNVITDLYAQPDGNGKGVGFMGNPFYESGTSLGSGDFNGDGTADLAIFSMGDESGGSNAGSVHVVYGSTRVYTADQNFALRLIDNADATFGFRFDLQAGDSGGYLYFRDAQVLGTGDFNGDGVTDITVGAPLAEAFNGRFYVLWGKSTSFADNVRAEDFPDTGLGFMFESNERGAELGFYTGGVGDIDGDRIDDLVAGVRLLDEKGASGQAFLLYGCGEASGGPVVSRCGEGVKDITLKDGDKVVASDEEGEIFHFAPKQGGGDFEAWIDAPKFLAATCADILDFEGFSVTVQMDDLVITQDEEGAATYTIMFYFSDQLIDVDNNNRRMDRRSLQTGTIHVTNFAGAVTTAPTEASFFFAPAGLADPSPFPDKSKTTNCTGDDWVRIIHRVNDDEWYNDNWNCTTYHCDSFRMNQLYIAAELFEAEHTKYCTKIKFQRIDPEIYVDVLEFEYRKKKHVPDVYDVVARDAAYLGDVGISESLTPYFLEWSRDTRIDQLGGFAGRVFYDYSVEGNWVASPTEVVTRYLLYRKDVFERTFGNFEPPHTWGQITTMARYINATEPDMWGFAHVGSANSKFLNLFTNRLQAEGGQWWDSKTEECSVTKSNKFKRATEWFKTFQDEGITPGYDLTEVEVKGLFATGMSDFPDREASRFTGNVAMVFGFEEYIDGTWGLEWDCLRDECKGTYRMAHASEMVSGKDGQFSILDGNGLAMSSRSDKKKHAWEWIRYLSDPDPSTGYLKQMATATLTIPARIEAMGLNQGFGARSLEAPFDAMPMTGGIDMLEWATPIQFPSAGSPLTNFLFENDLAVRNLQDAISGKIDIEDAASNICDRFDSSVDEYRAPTPFDTNTVLQDSWMIPLLVMNSIMVILCIGGAICVFLCRNYASIHFASWQFCEIMWAGCLIGLIGLYWWIIQPPRTWMCYLRIWFPPIAFILVFAPLTAKTWRINKLFNNKKFKVQKISNMDVFKFIGALMVVPIILCAVWSGIGNPEVDYIDVANEDETHFRQCSYDYFWIFMCLFYGYIGIILIANCYMAFRVRNVNALFNESKEIICAVYSVTILAAICIPLIHVFHDLPEAAQAITVCGAWAAIAFFLISMFWMKFYPIIRGKGVHFTQVNVTGQGTMGGGGGGTSAMTYADHKGTYGGDSSMTPTSMDSGSNSNSQAL